MEDTHGWDLLLREQEPLHVVGKFAQQCNRDRHGSQDSIPQLILMEREPLDLPANFYSIQLLLVLVSLSNFNIMVSFSVLPEITGSTHLGLERILKA